MGERVTVEGTVDAVIFHNEENGYTVLLLAVEGEEEPITVVGCIPCAAAGEGMTVTGVWTMHPVHGAQLTAESVERRLPRSQEDMVAYLSSGIIKGIGPATLDLIEGAFQDTEEFLTVEALSQRTGLAYQTTYRYLQHMVSQGLVEVSQSYGKVGRPKQKFRLKK